MDIESVCIVGGSGYVGRSVAEHLQDGGRRVRVLTRSRPRAMELAVLPTVELMVANPHEPADLDRAFEGMDAVVNLVGILHETRGRGFGASHVELPRKVAQAARRKGVQRLLHMSALGADRNGPSKYQRSKGEGEAAVREAAGDLALTIFRPSVIFGERDRFLNLFATLVRMSPVIPLAGAKVRFQPIWVEDVARCFAAALEDPRTFGHAYDLCGPNAYTLEQLVRFVAATLDKRRAVAALPDAIGRLQAFVFEHLPGKLMTRDNFDSMKVDNVCSGPFPPVFGFAPAAIESVVPRYMANRAEQSRFARFRDRAGR